MMGYQEQPLPFACDGEPLLGILAQPVAGGRTAVLIVVGGPQYRAGSHRQFVLLARALAAAGYPALRFDYRGMGDSGGAPRPFTEVGADIAAAVAALRAHCPQCERIVLCGLCDAASAILLYCGAAAAPEIAGLVLVNPWVRSAAGQARTQIRHYYRRRLLERDFWLKLVQGKVALGQSFGSLWRNVQLVRQQPAGAVGGGQGAPADLLYQTRMARAWRQFAGPILLLLSGNDYTAREFVDYAAGDAAWAGLLGRGNVSRVDCAAADHSFSDSAARRDMEMAIIGWLACAVS